MHSLYLYLPVSEITHIYAVLGAPLPCAWSEGGSAVPHTFIPIIWLQRRIALAQGKTTSAILITVVAYSS